jgi:NTE family protein
MGALIGGIHARGKLDVFSEWVRALRRNDIVQLLDIGWGRTGGLFKGERIIDVLKDLIGDEEIEQLPIAYTAVATDINRKREVWIDKGPLFDAIRASIAVPMLFAPVRRGHQLLLDGGVLNPLPIAPTLTDDTGLSVAVDVNGMDQRPLNVRMPIDEVKALEQELVDAEQAETGLRKAIADFIDGLLPGEDEPAVQGMFAIALEAMDTMQVTISRLKASVYTPDVLVQVPRNVAHFFEFERASELIDLGYDLMNRELEAPEQP